MQGSDRSYEYLDTVERCAIALGHKLSARDWETVWQNRREIGAYSVLVELKIAASEGSVLAAECVSLDGPQHGEHRVA